MIKYMLIQTHTLWTTVNMYFGPRTVIVFPLPASRLCTWPSGWTLQLVDQIDPESCSSELNWTYVLNLHPILVCLWRLYQQRVAQDNLHLIPEWPTAHSDSLEIHHHLLGLKMDSVHSYAWTVLNYEFLTLQEDTALLLQMFCQNMAFFFLTITQLWFFLSQLDV